MYGARRLVDPVSVKLTFVPLASMFFLLFAYPCLGMLWRHEYPVMSAEALIIFMAIGVVSVMLAALLTKVRNLVAYAVIMLAVLVVLLLQFNLRFEGLLVAIVCLTLMFFLTRQYIAMLLIPVLFALTLGVFLDTRLDARANNDISGETAGLLNLSPVIHLVMDSFGGVEGMPDTDEGNLTRKMMRDHFEASGFTLFPRAYSRFSSTVDSLSNAFNFRASEHSLYSLNVTIGADHRFDENRYFDLLSDQGYRIKVYQNESMDFCRPGSPSMDKCWSYTLPDLDSIRQAVDSRLLRARLLISTLVRQSSLIESLVNNLGLLKPWGIAVYQPAIFEKILQDIDRRPRGVVYFAHVLFPHGPYAYESDCRLDYEHEPWERFERMEDEIFMRQEVRDQRYRLYLRQTQCALASLEKFYSELRAKGLYEDSIIIVHGDHGSRNTTTPLRTAFINELRIRDFQDTYPVLYAIKHPNGKFSEIEQPMALENLMEGAVSVINGQPVTTQDVHRFFENTADAEVLSGQDVFLLGTVPMRRVTIDLYGYDDSN